MAEELPFIFVGGLDTRAGDFDINKQTDLVRKGYPNATFISFRYSQSKAGIKADGPTLNSTLLKYPTAPVLLFSAGCGRAYDIALFMKNNGLNLKNLYINEAYTVSAGTLNVVLAAVKLGVPIENNFVATYPEAGSNTPGNTTKLPRLKPNALNSHWDSLTAAGLFLNKRYGNGVPPDFALQPNTGTNGGGAAGAAAGAATGAAAGATDTVTGQENGRGAIPGQGSSSGLKTFKSGGPIKKITQLVQPTLKAKVIKVEMPPDPRLQKELQEGLGHFPIVWYNNYQIRYTDIAFFQLYTSENIPTLKLSFLDTYNLMKDKGFPLDDTKISIFINPRSEQLKPIHMDFKIVKFAINGYTYNITAVIDADQLYIKKFKSFSKKTSFQTLKSISEEVGLGFASNLDDTNDSMVWINSGKKYVEFIKEVLENSYDSDQSYLTAYIDFFYNFTFVDIERELNRNIEQELGVPNTGIETFVKLDQELVQKIFLTNNRAFSTTNSFFEEYRVINKSTSVSLKEGYSTNLKYYDEVKKQFLAFDLQGMTSDGRNTIIMKGAPQDDKFFNENKEVIYLGKLDKDNMYPNYHYSKIQNYRNLVELGKIGMEITMKTPNFNLYKFQKVFLNLANSTPTPSQTTFNNRLTGEWLIIDISYLFEELKFSQKIKLVKRELELSPEERKEESFTSKKSRDTTRGTSPNPDPGTEPTPPAAGSTVSTASTGAAVAPSTVPAAVASASNNGKLDVIVGTDKLLDNNKKSLELVVVDGAPVWRPVATAYLAMKEAAKKDGIVLGISSAFRPAFGPLTSAKTTSGGSITIYTQEVLRRDKTRFTDKKGNPTAARNAFKGTDEEFIFNGPSGAYNPATAPPGKSQHGNGLALDLNTGSRVAFSFKLSDKIYIWLVKNAHKYGFVRTVSSEEWHFEYKPVDAKKGPYALLSGKNGANLFYKDLGLAQGDFTF